MKRTILTTLLGVLLSLNSYSTHYMGGEITWECLTNGNYRFTLKAYRECYSQYGAAANYGNTQTLMTTATGFSSISLYRIIGWPVDISPVCNIGDTTNGFISCVGMTPSPNMGAVQEHIYNSDNNYPNGVNLFGIPPATGWQFYWGSCCRNPCTNIINASSKGWRLRAFMYPYNNQNTSTCYDNSPSFSEKPVTAICSGSAFTYNHMGVDSDGDSLAFSWGVPLETNGYQIVAYAAGYAYNSPYPNAASHPNNVPATLDPVTGEISFTSFTNGAFVSSVKVSSFRDGVKIAETYRDMQVAILSCGINNPPQIPAPFQSASGQFSSFIDTFYVGESVSFPMSFIDSGLLNNGMPQTLTVKINGQQFGDVIQTTSPPTMSTTAGCLKPPCAILYPAPPSDTLPYTGTTQIQTQFMWQTDCNHISSNSNTAIYKFLFNASDDQCPLPGQNMKTVTIVLKRKPPVAPPNFHTVNVLSNDAIQLNWTKPVDTLNNFISYWIYRSKGGPGNFQLVKTIPDINVQSFTDSVVDANYYKWYYYIRSSYGCDNTFSPLSNTLNIGTNVGISEKNNDAFGIISCIPNPTSGITKIVYNSDESTNIQLKLSDINGKEILTREIHSKPGENRIDIDLSQHPKGVYLFTLKNKEESATGKIIIAK